MTLMQLAWPRSTARLVLRPATADDLEPLWSWHRRAEVTQWMTRLADDHDRFAEHFLSHLDRTLVATYQGRVIGLAKIDVQDPWAQAEVEQQAAQTMAEIGWALDPAHHGDGLATEMARELLAVCFDGLGLRRVVAECFADNIASARVMEKIGMRREACYVANSLHRDGRWLDSFAYAMLAEEWAHLT